MKMHPGSVLLRNYKVARLQRRRKWLGLSPAQLLDRFLLALAEEGCQHSRIAAKRRLERVLNRRQRRPTTETTLRALARALDWTLLELEEVVDLPAKGANEKLRRLLFR